MGAARHVLLLGEDDREMRRLLAEMFRRDGWEVVEAWDGAHLLDLVLRRVAGPAIDVVVSDVRMPGMSGLDVLGAIRRRDAAIPVVLITAFGDAEVRRAALHLGAVLLDKPFALERLRSLVVGCARAH
jgi:DNA-binding NtrC family response regulator